MDDPQADAPLGAPADPALTAPPALSPPLPKRCVFIGPFGLRAGWSLLIYLALVFSAIFGVRTVQHRIKASHNHAAAVAKSATPAPAQAAAPKPAANQAEPVWPGIVGESIFFAVFFLISWLMAVIDRRKLAAFGLGGVHPLSRWLMGMLWGLLAMGLLIAGLYFSHLLVFDARLDHGWAILRFGLLQLLLFFLVGLTEEYVFRGYIQYTLTRGLVWLGNFFSRTHARTIAFWTASLITSAIFFIAHTGNGGENPLGLFVVFLAGLLLVIALWRTGSLWWAIGFHTAWDWSQSFLYGVPDSGTVVQGHLFATHALGRPLLSGGADGPEGSLLCIPVMLLVILVLLRTHPSPQPSLEPQPRKLSPSGDHHPQPTAALP